MKNEIIEAPDDSIESNVEASVDTEVVEAPEAQKAEESPAVDTEQTPEETPEETILFKGEQVPVSKIDQLMKDYENDSKWKRRNQEESEAIKKEKAELAQLQFLKSQIEQRPDVIQALLTPQKQRDIDAELREVYSKRPDPLDTQQYAEWEKGKDSLIYEKALTESSRSTTERMSKVSSVEHANALERTGHNTYVGGGKVSDEEFSQMTSFISQNVLPKDGRYPDNVYDYAYMILHKDKFLASALAEERKKTIAPILKASVVSQNAGKNKPQVQVTDEDEQDDAFSRAIRAKNKGKWISLPQ